MSTSELPALDLRGLNPAPVTPFTADGDVDHAAMAGLGKWLAGIDGVKSLVVLGHAGEGTFLTQDEQVALVRNLVNEVSVPIIAGITGEGTKVAVEEAKRAVEAGATAGLVYPSHGWLRFGYQAGRPAGPLQGHLRGDRPAADPVPVPGQHQGQLQPRHPARDRRPARRVRHQERRAEHAPLGHRDPGAAPREPGPADPVLPRRVPAAHHVRRRRPARRLRRPRPRAAARADRRRQGPATTPPPARSTTGCCR